MYITKVSVVLSALGILAAALTRAPGTAVLVSLVLGALVALDVLLAPRPDDIAISREAGASSRLGESIDATLTVTNNGRRSANLHVRDAWPPSAGVEPDRFSMTVPAKKRRRQTNRLTPTRRGTLKSAHVTIRCAGPLRLAGRQKSFGTDWSLRVLPRFSSRRLLPSRIMRLRELEGKSLLLVRGQGTEFDSLREYVAGDDVRAIDWRSSARRGETLVRTWRPERDREVVVLVDSGRTAAVRMGDETAFDSYLESTLLLGALATRAGDRVRVIAHDSGPRAKVHGDQSEVIHRIALAFADVEPSLEQTDWNEAASGIARLTHPPALIVILTSLGAGSIQSGLLEAIEKLSRKSNVILAAPRAMIDDLDEVDTLANTYQRASIARSNIEGRALEKEIASSGVTVCRTTPQELPGKVVDTYLELKARGRL